MRERKEINVQVGCQIRKAREAAGLTQERFAELMKDRAYLDACCAEGLEQAMRISRRTRDKVYKKMGFTL